MQPLTRSCDKHVRPRTKPRTTKKGPCGPLVRTAGCRRGRAGRGHKARPLALGLPGFRVVRGHGALAEAGSGVGPASRGTGHQTARPPMIPGCPGMVQTLSGGLTGHPVQRRCLPGDGRPALGREPEIAAEAMDFKAAPDSGMPAPRRGRKGKLPQPDLDTRDASRFHSSAALVRIVEATRSIITTRMRSRTCEVKTQKQKSRWLIAEASA
jgi:hypothetical protein